MTGIKEELLSVIKAAQNSSIRRIIMMEEGEKESIDMLKIISNRCSTLFITSFSSAKGSIAKVVSGVLSSIRIRKKALGMIFSRGVSEGKRQNL